MLAILHPNTDENSDDYRTTFQFLEELQDIQLQTHVVQGEQQKLTEIYLVGDNKKTEYRGHCFTACGGEGDPHFP